MALGLRCVFSLAVLSLLPDPTIMAHPAYTWNLVWQSPPSGGSTLFGLAYDPIRDHAVLLDNSGSTWIWNGSTWNQLTPHGSTGLPAARYNFAMEYDPANQAVVIFVRNRSAGRCSTS